jgi:hypothetical protein
VSAKLLFTTEELKEMGKTTLQLLEDAADAGDKEEVKRLARRMSREFLAMHDLFRDWITALLSFIGRRYGDATLKEALEESVHTFFAPLGKRYAGKNTRQQVQMLVAGLRGHLCPIDVEEDEEKFTITCRPCGSGGRQMLDGAYERPQGFLKVKTPQAMTFDRADFPVYCCHCYFQNQPLEADGKPIFVTEPSEKLGQEPCRIYLYK